MEPKPQPAVQIRRMRLDDLAQVQRIDTISFSMPWPERSFRYELTENENSRCWVAEVSREGAAPAVAALLVVWRILDEAHIATIAVHPDYRNLGIARKLMATALLDAYEEGARISFLEVRRGNLPAQHLYQRFGYEVVSIRPRYYKDNNEDALLMNLMDIDPEKVKGLLD